MEEKRLELIEFSNGIVEAKESLKDEFLRELYFHAFSLLPAQVESYTMGDSSSVPVEVAEELFKSILFTVKKSINMDKLPFNELLSCDIKALFGRGKEIIDNETKSGRELYDKVKASAPPIQNISYRDTLKGIGGFFQCYDSRFFAHEIPCSIDYQLCHNVSDVLLGIDYINEYLRDLLIENSFCALFEPEAMKTVLKAHSPLYKELLINLYEPLAVNALGLELINGDLLALRIGEEEQEKLYKLFKTLSKEECGYILLEAAKIVCRELQITDEGQVLYLKQTAVELSVRISAALKSGSLAGVFPATKPEKTEVTMKTSFVDGIMMDDEILREVIEEIKDCRFASDKAKIVLQEIGCLRDLAEVLDICFWDDECLELFKVMGKAELTILLEFARKREEAERSETGWEQKLFHYMKRDISS